MLGVNPIWYLRLPISVRFRRWHRFRTVRYLGYRVPVGHTAMLCSGCFTVLGSPPVLHRMLYAVCVVYYVLSVVCAVCVMCCVCCVLCRLCATNMCVSVIKSGYFGNLFGNSTNDPPFYWLISTAKNLTFLVYPCYNTIIHSIKRLDTIINSKRR